MAVDARCEHCFIRAVVSGDIVPKYGPISYTRVRARAMIVVAVQ